eukprot:Skav214045  [mRNA]  locus=scaffold2017:257190:261209:+ [translate_table: standard]
MESLESRAHTALQKVGSGLLPQQRGRASTTEPKLKYHPVTPLRRSRPQDAQVTFMGENYNHTVWTRQLRRLQSFARIASSSKDGHDVIAHREQLWQAIKQASGFPGGFAAFWQKRPMQTMGAPDTLPCTAPESAEAWAIFNNFHAMFQVLEKTLNRARWKTACSRREQDPNAVFLDVARQRALPVQTVMSNQVAQIVDISADRKCIEYTPHVFDLHTPVTSDQGLLRIASHQAGKITLAAEHDLEPEGMLYQTKLTAAHTEVCKEFLRLWEPMWNRHEGVSHDHWDDTIRHLVGPMRLSGPPLELPEITESQWRSTVRQKKSKGAMGPDGITKEDMLNLHSHEVAAFLQLFQAIEHQRTAWPSTMLVGLISALEKRSTALLPQHYRPITVLSYAYRIWSSIRSKQLLRHLDGVCPASLIGNRPKKAASDIWWQIALELEDLGQSGHDASGLVTDVCKAFNVLPRCIIQAIALKCGIPKHFIICWHSAMERLERRFVSAGGCSTPVRSCTGYAEGDPLSVVAMQLMNMALHYHFQGCQIGAELYSYVDNWEVVVSDPARTHASFAVIEQFARDVELALDKQKTFAWALNATSRKSLRDQGYEVQLHAPDLGGQMVYCRKRVMQTIKARLVEHQTLWHWMRRSPAPDSHKLKLLPVVAWTRCLHGVQAMMIGKDHFQKLRAAAMNAMGWSKRGANPMLQFGLSKKPVSDPEYYAIRSSFVMARKYANQSMLWPVIDDINAANPIRYQQGPANTLIQRAAQLGWVFEGNGYIVDHEALRWHVVDSPFQWFTARLEHAWYRRVGSIMADRNEFAGLQAVDVPATLATMGKLDSQEGGLARTLRNGTFFTRDKQFHAGTFTSKQCPFCSKEDSIEHRHWECEGLTAVYGPDHAETKKLAEELPDCWRHHGWCTEPPSFLELRHQFLQLPDLTHSFCFQTHGPGPIHLFTDGSGKMPLDPVLRVATWAVVCADVELGTFPIVAAGPLPGMYHTVLRAEITGAIVAFRYSLATNTPFYLWTDNQAVFERVRCTDSVTIVGCCENDHDLWNTLAELFTISVERKLYQGAVKVCSHQDPSKFSHPIELWAIAGNDSADRAATIAHTQLPLRFKVVWERCLQERKLQTVRRDRLLRHFLQVGNASIASKDIQRQTVNDQWDERPIEMNDEHGQHTFHDLPHEVEFPEGHPLEQVGARIHQWLRGIASAADCESMWVTSYQLLTHFQATTKTTGLYYDTRQKRWHDASDVVRDQGYAFLKCSGWFQACLKKFADHCGVKYHTEHRVPTGSLFKCWTTCVLLRISPAEIQVVNDYLASQNGPVKAVKRALATTPCAVNIDVRPPSAPDLQP